MKVAVVGVGAIGTLVALRLVRAARCEVVLCARSPFQRLEVRCGDETDGIEARPLLDPDSAGVVDWVLVCVKAQDSGATAPWLRRLRTSATPVAVLQNGVEHFERFETFVPRDRVLPVVVDAPCERLAAGVSLARGEARLTAPAGELAQGFGELFAGAPIDVVATPDWPRAAWSKLVRNCAGAARPLRMRCVELRAFSERETASRLADEALRVGRAAGVTLPDELAHRAADEAAQRDAERLTSLEADLRAGRATEVDARNGAVARIGRRLGVEAPFNELAARRLR